MVFSVGHVLFICLFPYSSQVLGPIFTELPVISSRDSFIKGQGHRGQRSNKVKVIKAKGQIYVFFSVCSPTSPRSLGRSSPNLVGRLRAAQVISWRGSFFQRSRLSRSKVKFLYLCSPWSDLHETW